MTDLKIHYEDEEISLLNSELDKEKVIEHLFSDMPWIVLRFKDGRIVVMNKEKIRYVSMNDSKKVKSK